MKFSTVVIDPPWPETSRGPRGSVRDNFPMLSYDGIGHLPVPLILRKKAHVYLWATQRSLRQAFHIMDIWGLYYKSLLVWAKPGLGSGFYYYRPNTEFVIFATTSASALPIKRRDLGTVFRWPRDKPQEKPDEFYDMVVSTFPGPRAELFARRERPGWTCWGDEVGDPFGWGFEPGEWP